MDDSIKTRINRIHPIISFPSICDHIIANNSMMSDDPFQNIYISISEIIKIIEYFILDDKNALQIVNAIVDSIHFPKI